MIDPSQNPPRRFDILPLVLLVAMAALFVAAWWLFPLLQHYVYWQDCAASGRTNC